MPKAPRPAGSSPTPPLRRPARAGSKVRRARFDAPVTQLLDALGHPRRAEIDALRALLLAAAPSIEEGVKWNAPSYRTTEWFATFHLRAKDRLQVVFHCGARSKAKAQPLRIADPEGLLQWRGTDRAIATIAPADVGAHGKALQAIVRAWIAQL